MSEKRVSLTTYVDAPQLRALRALSARTKVPVAVYIREGVDLALARHAEHDAAKPARQSS